MSMREGRGEVGLALAMLRMLRGWERADLVRALGASRSWISMIETGQREPSTRTVQRITGALGLPMSAVEEALGLVRSVRGVAAEGTGGGVDGRSGGSGGSSGRKVRRGGDPDGPADAGAGLAWDGSGLSGVLFELVGVRLRAGRGAHGDGGGGGEGAGGVDGAGTGAGKRRDGDPEAERRRVVELWDRLRRHGPEERRALVREASEFQNWALCERLCEESARVGTESPAAAVELAELALEVAMVAAVPVGGESAVPAMQLAGTGEPGARAVPAAQATGPLGKWSPDAERWRDWLLGYAWAFVGEARRLAGNLAEAEEALARSRELWPAGDLWRGRPTRWEAPGAAGGVVAGGPTTR
ncbi:MAG TPA: helix-turn-helix transcriptional regulator [Thermoanaerobaculia bacterium]